MKHKLAHMPEIASRATLLGSLSLVAIASSATGALTIFGSDNDGLGGFTTGSAITSPAWTTESDALRFNNDGTENSGLLNSSLLKEFTLNRTAGSSYTISGVLDIISTYAADNNRFGISLFATTVNLNGIDTGLSLQHNLGSGAFRILSPGVNGNTALASTTYNGLNGASAIGKTFTYRADVAFVGTDIEIDFTLTDENNFSQLLEATVAAASFEGTYFGFGTRARVRGTSPGVNDAPFIYDAKSFDVSLVPEPSTLFVLYGGAFGCLMLRRRPGSCPASQKRGLTGHDSNSDGKGS